MTDKQDLLKRVDDSYETFKEIVSGLSDQQMTEIWLGDWCIRDILAHIAGWHREMTGALGRLAIGERPTPDGVDYSDPEPWNARFVAEMRSVSPAEMVSDHDKSFAAIRAAANALPEIRFEPGRTVDKLINTSVINPYLEHGNQIREWRMGL